MTKKAVLVGLSDPLPAREREDIKKLPGILEKTGVRTEICPLLFAETAPSPEEKADAANRYFGDPETDFIFDVSGGDLANTVLPYLDFDAVKSSRATFFGFSDLSVVINAVIAKTGRPAVNWQVRNLLYSDSDAQLEFFRKKILTGSLSADHLGLRFLRGDKMSGRIFGGNIRCFLKLAGTPFWPEIDNGILLLESLGGGAYQMITALEQYKQLGVFDNVTGVILGTFTHMEERGAMPSIEEIVLSVTPPRVAVAATRLVGHYPDAKAIVLGKELTIG